MLVALLCATALSLLLALATAAVANAGVPSAAFSLADTTLVASPDGGFDYTVWLRDASNMPIANATIVLDFTGAPGIELCPSQDTDLDGKLIMVSDDLGHATFRVKAGGSSTGIVTVGYYGGGTQLVDARDPRDLKPYGHAVWGASEVWDSYWVPDYNRNDVKTDRRTNIAYSVDLVRGLDVYTVDLPGTDALPETGLPALPAGLLP